MKRIAICFLSLFLFYLSDLAGQTARDTAHAKVARAAVDTVRRTYPATIRKSPTMKRMLDRIAAAESLLIGSAPVPVPVPVPVPLPPLPVAVIAPPKCDSLGSFRCTFDGSRSTGARLTYLWKLGASLDGVNESTATGITTTYTYPREGPRSVTLTVTDSLARQNVAVVAFIVPAAPQDTAIIVVPPTPTPTPTPIPTPTTFVESIVGPLVSPATVSALGGVYAQYERDFPTYDEPQWLACGPKWDCIDYYDRAAIYYAWWKRTGDAKYLDRGNQVAVNFRDNYLAPNNYGLAHHWAMMDGVALHFLATQDPKSQLALARVGENFAWQVNGDPSSYFRVPTDLRINAYAIKSLLDAWLVKAPSNGQNTAGWPAVPDWAAVLRTALTKILTLRDADGQWRTARCTDGKRVSHPFTVGLLYDALVRYYLQFEPDPRIPAAIKQSADIMWSQDWIATSAAFKYVGQDCPGEGSATPAADLNQLIVNGYAFVGKTLGDPVSRARADSIFAGGVNGRGVTGDAKHLNQQFTSSYRSLAMRLSPLAGRRALAPAPPYRPNPQPFSNTKDDSPTPPKR